MNIQTNDTSSLYTTQPSTVTTKDLILKSVELAIRNVFRNAQLDLLEKAGTLSDNDFLALAKELAEIKNTYEPRLKEVLHK